MDVTGAVLFVDVQAHRVRRVSAAGIVSTVMGTGSTAFNYVAGLPGTSVNLNTPNMLALDSTRAVLAVNDDAARRVYLLDLATGAVRWVAGSGSTTSSGDGGPATSAGLSAPNGMAFHPNASANVLFIVEPYSRIRQVDLTSGVISTVAGSIYSGYADGPATSALFSNSIGGITFDLNGDMLITDLYRLRRLSLATMTVSTVAGTGAASSTGDGGLATAATLYYTYGVAVDRMGNIFVSEYRGNRIRRIDAGTGVITTGA